MSIREALIRSVMAGGESREVAERRLAEFNAVCPAPHNLDAEASDEDLAAMKRGFIRAQITKRLKEFLSE